MLSTAASKARKSLFPPHWPSRQGASVPESECKCVSCWNAAQCCVCTCRHLVLLLQLSQKRDLSLGHPSGPPTAQFSPMTLTGMQPGRNYTHTHTRAHQLTYSYVYLCTCVDTLNYHRIATVATMYCYLVPTLRSLQLQIVVHLFLCIIY